MEWARPGHSEVPESQVPVSASQPSTHQTNAQTQAPHASLAPHTPPPPPTRLVDSLWSKGPKSPDPSRSAGGTLGGSVHHLGREGAGRVPSPDAL